MDHRNARIPSSPTHDSQSSTPRSSTGHIVRRHHPLLNFPFPEQPYSSVHRPAAYSEQAALEEAISSAFSEQASAVEAALSRLSLGGPAYLHRQPLRPPSPIVGEGFLSQPFVERLWAANGSCDSNNRALNAVNDGQSFGVGPVYPTVGPLGNRTTAVPNSWYRDDTVQRQQLSHEFDHTIDQYKRHAFLLRKKQLLSQLNYQPQTYPSPTLNAFGPNSTNVVNHLRPNLYNHLLPEHVNFLNLEDFRGRIVEFAKDQNGCRILQLKFENPSHEEIEMVLTEVIDHMDDLMTNQFGNYLIQKLAAVCNDEQRIRIIRSLNMAPFQLIIICNNPHGAKAVQNLLECHPDQASLLIAGLSPGAAALAKDPNGHHVIQYCLMNFPYSCNQILNEIAEYCFEIAIDQRGCCVLQTCVQISNGETRHALVSQIIANAIPLAADPYGNYVLQHMLGLRVPEITENLLRQLEGNFVSLACNKYASNVVEKCLVETSEEQSTRIIMEMVRSPNAPMLLLDPYGNFVIQSALSVSKVHARSSLLNLVNQNVPLMRSNQFGKKILAFLEKMKVQHAHN